ncbi:MAG: aminoacyl-tRNA hydrolase [Tenericutes bacterium 4572_104]|nr:MAG: aminoacyl-tRNA hydrolase [Tenericutes bacterium 4572_104]
MKLIVGLGNIGEKYSRTRHNIGFITLDNFAKHHGVTFEKTKNYFVAKYGNAILIKPRTYMNLSGLAVQSIMTKNRNITDILVVVDDMDLQFAKIRIRKKGGTGGHNGLKSISSALGSGEYGRIRIGIGRPNSNDVKQFVLDRFNQDELKKINILNEYMIDLLDNYISDDIGSLLNFNSANNVTYSEKIGIN